MEFTKEQLIEHVEGVINTFMEAVVLYPDNTGMKMDLRTAEIALASLEAKPVAFSDKRNLRDVDGDSAHTARMWGRYNFEVGDMALYAAPPAPVLPEELLSAMEEVLRISDRDHEAWHQARAGIVACRAAMQGKAVGTSTVIPEVWVAAINALLDSDGSRGCFDAMDQRKARDEIERLLAAVPQRETT